MRASSQAISPDHRPRLVVMVKEPRPGRVKTRLGADIGMVDAAWWFRHRARSLLRRMRDPRWDLLLAVAPDIEGLQSRVWPPDIPRLRQGAGDLGTRMAGLFRGLPPGPAIIVGADIPRIMPGHIARGFAELGSKEAVFGPATDGGYWLVGFARRRAQPPGIFANVRWSSPHALADSIASLPGMRIGYADMLDDVDTVEDLRRLSR